jgi:hypothetical protein
MLKVALLVGTTWLAASLFCAHVWVTVALARERGLGRVRPR